jgi:dolichol-phosphate mannosyltransferase
MVAYTRTKLVRLLKVDFVRFCIVGGTGFVINFILLTFLNKVVGMHIFLAQFIGAEVALFSNFMLHHHWTYKHHKVEKEKHQLLVQFHLTSWPAIVGSASMVTICEHILHFSNFTALATSSAIALLWNFLWSKYVIWRKVTTREIQEGIA